MHFLTILLLTVGVTVAMGATLIALSYALGQFFHSQEAGGLAVTGPDAGARCLADAEWYAGLPAWKQAVTAGWWWTNRIRWAAKGHR